VSNKNNVKKEKLKKVEEAELYDAQGNLVARGNINLNFNTKKKPNKYFESGDFVTMGRAIFRMLKKKRDYNNLTFRLFFELLDRVDFNNRIKTFRQSELAEVLEAQQPHISVSLKMLMDDKIIEKREYDYYFTEEFVRYASDAQNSK